MRNSDSWPNNQRLVTTMEDAVSRKHLTVLGCAASFTLSFLCAELLSASSFTPLEWQQEVRQHAIKPLVGQNKHTTWLRDRNRNFIDDEIEARFHKGELVNVVVDLNTCLSNERIHGLLVKFGRIKYVGKLVTFVLLDGVRFERLPEIAALPEVAMIEWQMPMQVMNDVSTRTVQARKSITFSTNTAEDHGFTGTGVNVAIVDTGVDDTHEAFAGKFVAGFNTFDVTDPGDGSRHTGDDNGHGTHVAGTVLALETAGRNCRTPDDGSPTNCGGMAPGAGVVAIKVCNAGGGCPNLSQGLDWLGTHASQFHIRVANISISACTDDDGTSALAQQVNYLAAIGVVVAVAHGNSPNCGVPGGTKLTPAPGSASFAITVDASDDRGTISRTDDVIAPFFLVGPRMDFNLMSPDLMALKPDITAPGVNIFSAQAGSTNLYFSDSGTSMASPHVAGAAADIIQARPDIDPGSLKDLLLRNADFSHNVAAFPAVNPTWDTGFGSGILNVWNAINAAAATDVGFPSCIAPPATAGGLCGLSGGMPPWENTADITTASPPTVGVPNTIVARVKNNGAVPATVLVNFGVYVFGVGNNQFFHVGTVQVTIAPGATVNVNQPWTPSASNHQCAQVSVQYGLDTNFGNNVTQRNLSVAPSTFEVRVENPFMVPAKFETRVKSRRDGWKCAVREDTFTQAAFDCPHILRVDFEAPKGTELGQQGDCDVAVYATPQGTDKAQLIGGVTVRTIVPKPCQFTGSVVDAEGQALPGARLEFRMEDAEVASRPPMNVVTDADGNFTIVLTPYRNYRVLIEKQGNGKAEVSLKPMCGLCLRFMLRKDQARLVP
jgi:hypothetical protein